MSDRPVSLRVIVADAEPQVSAVVRRALLARGHHVRVTQSADDALDAADADVLVLDLGLVAGSGALELLRGRGHRPRAVLTTTSAIVGSVSACFGADRLLVKPFRIEDVVAAVEAVDPRELTEATHARRTRRVDAELDPALAAGDEAEATAALEIPPEADEVPGGFRRALTCDAAAVDAGVRALLAWALRLGVGPSARARLGTAVAEVLDNARRHAYPAGEGPITLDARLENRAVRVCVTDRGIGFDGAIALATCPSGPALTGLARVAALCEELAVHGRGGDGARVELAVHLHATVFDAADVVDLSETDWLSPELARRVIAALDAGGGNDPFQLSPAVAVTVGRLLHGPDTRGVLQSALWST